MDADQGGRVVRHDGHPRLDDRTAMTFVGEARGSTAQQARHDAFDDGAAVATRVGELHLGRGPDVVQVRLLQAPEDVLRRGRRGQGLDRPGDPHRENPSRVQRLTQGGVIERQIAGQRVDGRGRARRDPGDGVLHFVKQGLHRPDVTGIAHGQMQGKDKASRWRGDHPRLAAERVGQWRFPWPMGASVGS